MKNKRKKFLLLLISTLLSFVILEVVLHVLIPRERVLPPYYRNRETRFVEHPFLPYTHRANDVRTLPWKHAFFGDFVLEYRTNSHGFLGDEFSFDKGNNELRILTFGGSTTWAMGIDRSTAKGTLETTWPEILEDILEESLTHREVTVYNLAQDAYSSPMSVVNLAFVGVDLKPDIVINYDGINDMSHTFGYPMRSDYVGRFGRMNEYRSIGLRLPGFLLNSYAVCMLVKMSDRFLFPDHQEAFAAIAPPPKGDLNSWNSPDFSNSQYFFRNLKTMNGICKEYGAAFIGSTMHYFKTDPVRDEFNDRLRRFFQSESIPYFDADRILPKEDETLNTDEVHFTRRGTRLMARGYAEVVLQILNDPNTPLGEIAVDAN